MSKICWRCGNPHEEGDKFCMQCGAGFATKEDKYQTDGRTISDVDDKAYLTAPPPKYKRNRTPILVGIVVFAVVLLVAIPLFGSVSNNAEVTYEEYKIEKYYDPDADRTEVYCEMWVYNHSDHLIDTSNIYFTAELNGRIYGQIGGTTMTLTPNTYALHGYQFNINGRVQIDGIKIVGYSDSYSIKHE